MNELESSTFSNRCPVLALRRGCIRSGNFYFDISLLYVYERYLCVLNMNLLLYILSKFIKYMPCTIFFLIYNLLIISSFIGCPRQRLFYQKLDIHQIVIEILMIWLDIFSLLSVSSTYSTERIIFVNNASKCSNSKKILGCFHIYLLNLP